MLIRSIIENIADEYGGPANSLPNMLGAVRNELGLHSVIYSVTKSNNEKNEFIARFSIPWVKCQPNGFDKLKQGGELWLLSDAETPQISNTITLYHSFPKIGGVIPLPYGAATIRSNNSERIASNQMGAYKISGSDGRSLSAEIQIAHDSDFEAAADGIDLLIPKEEQPHLQRLSDSLKLSAADPAATIATLHSFFRRHFSYSTYVERSSNPQTTLSHFLNSSRSGHCEFFATATVFLLRQAGIAARYVVGYSAQEQDSDGFTIVRQRHGHAWAEAYVDDRWQSVDTTPPNWDQIDGKDSDLWRPIIDQLSQLWFQFSLWRSNDGERSNSLWVSLAR